MDRIVVCGGRRLCGRVFIGGSKNAALPLLFAGILTGDTCVFSSLPRVSDVFSALEILRFLGARIHFLANGDVEIDYSDMRPLLPAAHHTSAIRGSVYLLGAMLGRFGRAMLGGVGGCDFGDRPIDQHLYGFSLLGATDRWEGGVLSLAAEGGLTGADICLKMPSVGATANLLLAATAATGVTVIRNAAAEPHVTALCRFLINAGADIRGVGSNELLVTGGQVLHGCRVRVIPDMIEAGTYLAAAMATGGEVTVVGADATHLVAPLATLREMGATARVSGDEITVAAPPLYRSTSIITGPYPAFPTDLHPQFAALLALGGRAMGQGEVCERVWASRFRYAEELSLMGALTEVSGDTLTVTPSPLHPARLTAPDLRGGAALLLAALATEGKSEIAGAHLLARGYEHLEQKLRALGADVTVY